MAGQSWHSRMMRLSGSGQRILWLAAISLVLFLSWETISASTSLNDDSSFDLLVLSTRSLAFSRLPEDETSAPPLDTTTVVAQVDSLTTDYHSLDTLALQSALLNTASFGYSCGNLVPYWRGHHRRSAETV
ncbi:hypothetical protein PSACC_00359 [Paramicrosporidium saccamoebae]|uniref:Uncharacterized protein n=1 Tax=Paramicrosporidium saccamoebae TaxID=1246581 RepID=A0A2H9TPX1_9FUNG|nr:hypothetical protein PSACC_00359 [Paramicrosporidium saccamoebae]